jgi:phosphatidylethanolamine/phosphatidyl-N-methylethanolamine N-methyltransferase
MDMEPAGPVSSPEGGGSPAPEAVVFALGALRGRSRVGAIAPASPWLARAVARAVARSVPDEAGGAAPWAAPGMGGNAVSAPPMRAAVMGGARWHTVVEVGAGTGALTRAILDQPRLFRRFVAIESDARFARWLRCRFPQIEVVRGCASQIARVIEPGSPTVVVSSLPFRSMSRTDSARCIRALCDAIALSERSALIQYSYGFGDSPPFPAPSSGLRWSVAQRVLLNLPPATVWTLKHIESPEP